MFITKKQTLLITLVLSVFLVFIFCKPNKKVPKDKIVQKLSKSSLLSHLADITKSTKLNVISKDSTFTLKEQGKIQRYLYDKLQAPYVPLNQKAVKTDKKQYFVKCYYKEEIKKEKKTEKDWVWKKGVLHLIHVYEISGDIIEEIWEICGEYPVINEKIEMLPRDFNAEFRDSVLEWSSTFNDCTQVTLPTQLVTPSTAGVVNEVPAVWWTREYQCSNCWVYNNYVGRTVTYGSITHTGYGIYVMRVPKYAYHPQLFTDILNPYTVVLKIHASDNMLYPYDKHFAFINRNDMPELSPDDQDYLITKGQNTLFVKVTAHTPDPLYNTWLDRTISGKNYLSLSQLYYVDYKTDVMPGNSEHYYLVEVYGWNDQGVLIKKEEQTFKIYVELCDAEIDDYLCGN